MGRESRRPPDLDGLTWSSFLRDNLLPVTLGNLIGGTLMVGGIYWLVYLRPERYRRQQTPEERPTALAVSGARAWPASGPTRTALLGCAERSRRVQEPRVQEGIQAWDNELCAKASQGLSLIALRKTHDRQPRGAAGGHTRCRGGERDGIRGCHVESTAPCEQKIWSRPGAKSLGADHGGVETLVDRALTRRLARGSGTCSCWRRRRLAAGRRDALPPDTASPPAARRRRAPRAASRAPLPYASRGRTPCWNQQGRRDDLRQSRSPGSRGTSERPRASDVPRRTCGSRALDRTG